MNTRDAEKTQWIKFVGNILHTGLPGWLVLSTRCVLMRTKYSSYWSPSMRFGHVASYVLLGIQDSWINKYVLENKTFPMLPRRKIFYLINRYHINSIPLAVAFVNGKLISFWQQSLCLPHTFMIAWLNLDAYPSFRQCLSKRKCANIFYNRIIPLSYENTTCYHLLW